MEGYGVVTDQTFGLAELFSELLLFGSAQMTEPFLQNTELFSLVYIASSKMTILHS